MQNIIFVSHCILNTASKVVMYEKEDMAKEENLRRHFLALALDLGVQIIQLPCPEFTLYGANRWGHTKNQFDNPFFIEHCKKILNPIMIQLKEYIKNKEKFRVLGIAGIDGSPSCGVKYTCLGDWGGNLTGRNDLKDKINSADLTKGSGVFMEVFINMLKDEGITVEMTGLFADEPDRIMKLLEKCNDVGV